jgi:L-ascorbate metabolism protein UlaG (beta-lactamase superfamily)
MRLVRHATVELEVGGRLVLVDPMLDDEGAHEPVANTPNDRRNPLVPLPQFDPDAFDAVLVTHTHEDHLDDAARDRLSADLPVFCQPADPETIGEDFEDVRPVDDSREWDEVAIHRVPARHGHGTIAERMAPSSGFVLETDDRLVYLTGDTVWYDGVERTLDENDPDVVVANAGAAQFTDGRPVTLTKRGVAALACATDAHVVAVHMEAINHCLESRDEPRDHLEQAGLADGVSIPYDGERIDRSR